MKSKIAAGAVAVVALVLFVGGVAGATPPTAESIITAGSTSLKDELLNIATAVMPFAAALIAVGLGWRFARKVLKLG